MRIYTEKYHAKRLLGMLNKKNPCLCCPAQKMYKSSDSHKSEDLEDFKNMYSNDPCEICCNFIGLPYYYTLFEICPCYRLKKKAIKKTWLSLEEKGYI